MAPDQLRRTLAAHGQAHLLDGVDRLHERDRSAFLARLAAVPWAELAGKPPEPPTGEVAAPTVLRLAERSGRERELTAAGEAAYAAGRVAVLLVAGGEGTRLGSPGPKGCLPIGPHSGKSIYQLQAEKVLSVSRRVGRPVPLLVMTSPATDSETRDSFEAHGSFGLDAGQVRFVVQGTLPSVDRHGHALLTAPGRLLESPDGHGGSVGALAESGELDRLHADGVDHLVYIQVDNILARVDDPFLVGLADGGGADVVTKVLEKRDPEERVGNLVQVGGRNHVVEYTELTPEQARARDDEGRLLYRWASPALHLWSVPFLARLRERGFEPPLHRSAKPLRAWVDGEEREVQGWKHERFVFDLIPEAERSVALEIDRDAEFAPVKNATGPDSPETAVELAHRQYVAWLRAAGARVDLPAGERVEISPLLAATPEQFRERWDGRPLEVTAGLYLDAR